MSDITPSQMSALGPPCFCLLTNTCKVQRGSSDTQHVCRLVLHIDELKKKKTRYITFTYLKLKLQQLTPVASLVQLSESLNCCGGSNNHLPFVHSEFVLLMNFMMHVLITSLPRCKKKNPRVVFMPLRYKSSTLIDLLRSPCRCRRLIVIGARCGCVDSRVQ